MLFLSFNRCSKSCNRVYSFVYSMPNCIVRHIKYLTPLRKCLYALINCYLYIASSIISLFCLSSPYTIFWGVVSVSIYPFYSAIRRGLSHISYKIIKIIPSFTNRYPSTSIPYIIRPIRVVTSTSHTFPFFIRSCFRSCVCSVSYRSPFFLCAPTRCSVTCSEGVSSNYKSVSTYTAAHPTSMWTNVIACFYNGQATKSLAGKVKTGHFHLNHGGQSCRIRGSMAIGSMFSAAKPIHVRGV